MELKSSKVLILGGAGFVGSQLAAEFVKQGAKVTIIDGLLMHTGANMGNIRPISRQVAFYKSKVEDLESFTDLIGDSDLIVDSMGLTSHRFGMKNPFLDLSLNLTSHLHVIDTLKGVPGKKVVYLGSRAQYGKGREPVIDENSPQEPVDTQGTFKAAAENLYRIYAKVHGFKVISLRVTNCFGENQKTEGPDIGLVGMFVRDIFAGTPVEIYGNSQRKKNLIYVKDLARIVAQISELDLDFFEAFNVAGSEVSIDTLLENIIRLAGKGEYRIREFPENIKNIDVGDAIYDDGKLKACLGRLNFTELSVALENTMAYFREAPYGEESNDI